jgi:hypothetical protein
VRNGAQGAADQLGLASGLGWTGGSSLRSSSGSKSKSTVILTPAHGQSSEKSLEREVTRARKAGTGRPGD